MKSSPDNVVYLDDYRKPPTPVNPADALVNRILAMAARLEQATKRLETSCQK